MNAISVKRLKKTYRSVYWERIFPPKRKVITTEALKGISFDVNKGEIFSLLGPNGAGKTTTLSILAGLLLPDEGEAFINGHSVVAERSKVQLNVGLVTGGNPRQFYNKLTGLENLIYFASLYNIPKGIALKRALRLLEVVDLIDKKDALFEDYSTGMMQRLAIARALMHDPPILLLDEPTLGLDPKAAHDMRKFIKKKLKEEMGKTIILTTHYMMEAEELADRVAIINEGKIVAIGTPEELKRKVKREAVEIIMSDLHHNPQELLSGLDGLVNIHAEPLDSVTGSWRVKLLLDDFDEAELLGYLIKRNGFKIKSFKVVEPTLEEVFLELTAMR